MSEYNYSELTVEEIDQLISEGKFTEQDVIDYYGNEWWRDDNVFTNF